METKTSEEKRRKTKKKASFPITYSDWYGMIIALIVAIPVCAVLVFLVALVIKSLFS